MSNGQENPWARFARPDEPERQERPQTTATQPEPQEKPENPWADLAHRRGWDTLPEAPPPEPEGPGLLSRAASWVKDLVTPDPPTRSEIEYKQAIEEGLAFPPSRPRPRMPDFTDVGMGMGGPAHQPAERPVVGKTPTGERAPATAPTEPSAEREFQEPPTTTAAEAAGDEMGAFSRGFLTGSRGQYRTSVGNLLETLGGLSDNLMPISGVPLLEGLRAMRDPMKRLGQRIEEAGDEYLEKIPGPGKLKDVRSVEDFMDWALFSVGQGVASTLPSIAGGIAGGAVAGPVGAVGGAVLPSFAMNLGELRDELEAEGVPSDQADVVASAGAVPMAMLDAVMPGRVGSQATKGLRQQATKHLAKRLASGYARGGLEEGVTETLQTAIKQGITSGVTDRPLLTLENLEELYESGLAGGLTGGALSSVAASAEGLLAGQQETQEEMSPLELKKAAPEHYAALQDVQDLIGAGAITPDVGMLLQARIFQAAVRGEPVPEIPALAEAAETELDLKGGKVPEDLEASGMRFRPGAPFTDKAPVSPARVPRDTEPARTGMEFRPNVQFVDEAPVTGPRVPTDVEPRPRIRFPGEEGTAEAAEATETPSEAYVEEAATQAQKLIDAGDYAGLQELGIEVREPGDKEGLYQRYGIPNAIPIAGAWAAYANKYTAGDMYVDDEAGGMPRVFVPTRTAEESRAIAEEVASRSWVKKEASREARPEDLQAARYIAEQHVAAGTPMDADAFRVPAEQEAYETRYRQLAGEESGAVEPTSPPAAEQVEEELVEEQAEEPTPPAGLPFSLSEDEIPLDVARAAHTGTSWTPDKRAEGERRSYVEHVRAVYEGLSRLAKTDEQKAILAEEMKEYKADYRQRYLDYLRSRHGLVSSFVAGPSGFPAGRMQKKGDQVHNKLNSLIEWSRKAQRRIRKAVAPTTAPISADQENAPELLRKKIEDAKAFHGTMKMANQIIRKLGTEGDEVRRQLRDLGLKPQSIEKILTKDFAGRVGYPDYVLANNRKEIRRLEDRLEQIEATRGRPVLEDVRFEDGFVEEDAEANRLRIYFDMKPEKEVRDALKSNGFRWAPKVGAWQRQRGEAAFRAAETVLGIEIPRPTAEAVAQEEEAPVVEPTVEEYEEEAPAPEPEPAPTPAWQTRQPREVPATGKQQQTLFPGNNRKVQTEYALMEASDLYASHTPDFSQRPAEEFPPEIQGRAYHGTRGRQAREHTEQIVSAFDPQRALDQTISAAEGPPVVTPQGTVIAGNGRTIVLQKLPPAKLKAYKDDLKLDAELFGINSGYVDRMDRPVLVRILTDDAVDLTDVDQLRQLNAASDVPTGKAKDVLSDAASRADQFRASTAALDHFAATVDENQTIRSYLETAAGRTFLAELVQSGVIAPSERARYIDASTGTATDEGKQMVERLFYAAAIGDADVVARAPSGILRKLDTALPAIIRADRIEGREVGPRVRHALDLLASARATNQTVDDLVAQVDLTRPAPEPAVADMARFLDSKQKQQVRDTFRAYAKDAEAWGRQVESDDLFGYKPRGPEEARRGFAALVPRGPIAARFRHFNEVPWQVKALRAGEIHPLAPMTDLFGQVIAEAEAQGELLEGGGIQGMSAAVADARAVVSQLEGKVQRGAATKAEEARYNEARTVIRAHERRGLDEGEVRARRPKDARAEPDDTYDMFGDVKPLHPLQQVSEQLPAAARFTQQAGELKEIRSPTATIADLRAALSKAMEGLKVGEGRIPRRGALRHALGVFKTREQVVRLTDFSDIVTFGHEAGHAMQKLFYGADDAVFEAELPAEVAAELEVLAQGISDESLAEGWAEFWRRYLDNPEVLEEHAPQALAFVEQILEQVPGVRNAWIDAREEWRLYREASPQSRIRAKISKDEDPATLSIADRWSRARTNYLDDFEPLRRLMDWVREQADVKPGEDVELLARLTRGSTGHAERFLEHGTMAFHTRRTTGKSLREILAPVRPMLDDFRDYMVARRALELHDRNILTGIRQEDAEWVVKDLDSKFGETFKPAFRDLQDYNRSLLKYLVDAGVISDRAMRKMVELNQNYVPFYRVRTGEHGGSLGLGFGHLFSPIKRIHGSGRDLIDPLESIVKNTMLYTHLAAKQEVSNALARLARKEGIGEHLEGIIAPTVPTKFKVGEVTDQMEEAMPGFTDLLEELQEEGEQEWAEMTADMTPSEVRELQRQGKLPEGPWDPAQEMLAIFRPGEMFREENVISVLRGDKRSWYEVDPELYQALQGLDREMVPRWAQILSKPARLLRAGATLAPEFQIRNPARDQVMAYVQSEYGYKPYIDLARGVLELIGKGEAYQQWLAGGGQRAALLALDRKRMQQSVREMVEAGGVKNVVKHPIDALRAFSAFMEDGTRMGEFLRGRQAEAKRLGVEPSELPKEAIQRIAGSTREVSIDFARHGAQLSTIRVLSAFWNARLQGYDRLARAFKKNPVQATTRAFVAITVPSLLEYYLNRDDEDYWELAQWRRDLFWNIRLPDWLVPGDGAHFLSWPKPFELGLVFGTLPTRILEWADTQDPEGLSKFFSDTMLREVESMAPFPTVFQPFVEGLTNYSFFFRRPLDPRSEEDVRARFRGTETASEVAKQLARWAPGEEGVSPRKIDNLLFSWTGGLGRHATGLVDLAVDAATGDRPPKRPVLQRLPGVRGVIAGEAGFNSESIERFYREYERVRSAERTLRYFEQRGMWREFEQEIEDAEANHLRARASMYRAVADDLAGFRARRDQIRRDPLLDGHEKEHMIRELGRQATEIARTAIDRRTPTGGSP